MWGHPQGFSWGVIPSGERFENKSKCPTVSMDKSHGAVGTSLPLSNQIVLSFVCKLLNVWWTVPVVPAFPTGMRLLHFHAKCNWDQDRKPLVPVRFLLEAQPASWFFLVAAEAAGSEVNSVWARVLPQCLGIFSEPTIWALQRQGLFFEFAGYKKLPLPFDRHDWGRYNLRPEPLTKWDDPPRVWKMWEGNT